VTPRAEQGGQTWLLSLVAPLVWFAHFGALYGAASFGHAAGMGAAAFEVFAWAATLVACIAVAVAWRHSQRSIVAARSNDPARGAPSVAATLALLSLAGILFQAIVLAMVPA
jgi:hypothetical protein